MKQDKTSMLVEPSKLVPWERNPRHNDGAVDKVAASIKELGFGAPIVARKGSNEIIAGHTRWKAAQKLGLEVVPVRFLDISDEKAQTMALADNKLGEIADWNNELLQEIALDLGDELMDLAGFDEPLTEVEEVEGNTDPDDVPEAPEEPTTKPGDLWILGEHRLLCGDSTNIQHVEKLMDGEKAKMLHTDPPYGVDYEGVNNDHLKADDLSEFLSSCLTNAYAWLEGGSNIYVWHADIHAQEFISAFKGSGFTQARPSTLHWVKDSLVLSMGDYHVRSEPCLFGWKEGSGRVRVKDRSQDNIWEFPKPRKAEGHPTMKPVELCERAIKNSSERGFAVLDLFGGSGSTLIACEKTRRKARLMELDPKYCDVIVKRWEDFTGNKAELADG